MSIDVTTPLIQDIEPNMSNHQYWRPWTLRKSWTISFTTICVGLLIVNELAIFGCKKHGSCHVFGRTDDGTLPSLSILVYTTIPIIIGIILSLVWILPHHDILRLEPYFQMSINGGAKASNSIFLQYPFEMVFLLPFKALFNEHYIVALSSSILLLMNFVIVPLVPAMFDEVTTNATIIANGSRIEFNATARDVPANFTFIAYDFAWRNGSLAPYMTEEYALLPVKQLDQDFDFLPRENWTVETTLFEASLDCANSYEIRFNYSYAPGNNSMGVEIYQNATSDTPTAMFCDAFALQRKGSMEELETSTTYEHCNDITAFMTPGTLFYSAIPEDPQLDDRTLYVFGWASGPSTPPDLHPERGDIAPHPAPGNITSIFCRAEYYTQTVNATFSMPVGKIIHVERLGERTRTMPLPAFETIMDKGPTLDLSNEALFLEPHPPTQNNPIRFGFPTDKNMDVKYEIIERYGESKKPVMPDRSDLASRSNVFMSSTNALASFALYNKRNETLRSLLDPRELESTIEKTLKLWFAFAVATESATGSGMQNSTVLVERSVPQIRITVNPYWSLGARIGLPLVVALSALLRLLMGKRQCHLDAEPNTMASALKLLSISPGLRAVMQYAEFHPLKTLMKGLDDRGIYFQMCREDGASPQIRVFQAKDDQIKEILAPGDLGPGVLALPESPKVQRDSQLISPDLMAVFNIIFFPIAIVLLVIIYKLSDKQDGFPMPGGPTSFQSKVLYDYVPMAFGSLAEYFLISLGSTQCLTTRYRALITGEAKYTELALKVDYNNVPPAFQLVQSSRSRQFLLVGLSATILVANVIPVFLGGIFYHSIYIPKIPKSHDFNETLLQPRPEIFFQLGKNITSGFSPSWTTGEYYVDSPFVIAPPEGEDTYNTRAFGLDISCTIIPDDRIKFPCSNTSRYLDYNSTECSGPWRFHDNVVLIKNICGGSNSVDEPFWWNGTSGELLMQSYGCINDRLFPIWAQNERYTINESLWNGTTVENEALRLSYANESAFSPEDDYRVVVLDCSLTDKIADVRATVSDGVVLSLAHPVEVSTEKNVARNHSLAVKFSSIIKELSRPIDGNNPLDRFNSLMTQVNDTVTTSRYSHVPSGPAAAEAFASVLRRLFPLFVRLYAEDLFGVTYVVSHVEYRVRVVEENFGTLVGLLVLFLCVVLLVFIRHRGNIKGHLPWCLAGMYSQLYASNVIDDMRLTDKKRIKDLELSGYAYGDYPPTLGTHHGVYRVQDGPKEALLDQKQPITREISEEVQSS